LRSFKWYLNHGAIDCAGSLNMMENPFVNDIFTNRLFHGQVRIGVRSHYFRPPYKYEVIIPCLEIQLLRKMIPAEKKQDIIALIQQGKIFSRFRSSFKGKHVNNIYDLLNNDLLYNSFFCSLIFVPDKLDLPFKLLCE
jgi:hypothetical protein